MAKLLVIQGNDLGKQYELSGDIVSIGRDQNNDLQVRDQEVSRIHALIKMTEDGYLLADQNSSNGTFVNDRRIKKHYLNARDLIQIGQTTLMYETAPFHSSVDPRSLVQIHTTEDPDSGSKIVETISAKVALPSYDEDSQITDSFLDHLEENIHVIYHTAVATSRFTKIEELHQKVLQLIFDWVKADRACVLLVDENSDEMIPVAYRSRSDLTDSKQIDIDRSILEYVRERNEGILASEMEKDGRWIRNVPEYKGDYIEAMCVPMHGRMGVVGFIYVENYVRQPSSKKKPDIFEQRFTKQQLKMLLAVAHQAALATENATYYTSMTQNAQLAAVGETFTQIAHHLRNMLQGLESAKRRVNKGLQGEDYALMREGWSEIEPLTTRIYNLSLNLLSFSKPRQPELAVDSLNDAVQDVISKVETIAQSKGIQIDWEPNLEIKPFAFDSEAIYRAVLNVVQNAIDACKVGCVVKVRLIQNQKEVDISVIDDGEGIDPKKINLIFKPFASTRGELGTGIGLPVSKKILREHGGDIQVSSALGHGSRFTLRLPIRRVQQSPKSEDPDTSMRTARE